MSKDMDLWVEEFRPTNFDDGLFMGQEAIVNSCRNYIKSGSYPHLILSGPAGTGKTTTALILADDISGPGNTMIKNASDENNIDIFRNSVKNWIKMEGTVPDIYKTLILDEGDNISKPAQQVLRRMLEEHSAYFRLIITCNYPNKIIDPIFSRCVHHRYKKLPNKLVLKRLYTIANNKKLPVTTKNLKRIVLSFGGDMRRCINILNAIHLGSDIDALLTRQNPLTFIKYITNSSIPNLKNYIDNNIYSNVDTRYLIERCVDILTSNFNNTFLGKINLDKVKAKELLRLLVEGDYRLSSGSQYYSALFWVYLNFHQ